MLQRVHLFERHLSDVDPQKAQHQHHTKERTPDGGIGVFLDRGRGAGRGAGQGSNWLFGQQVLDVKEGAVVWKRSDGQDVAHEGVQVDSGHGGLDVILAKGRPVSHKQRLHAV